MNPRLLVIGIWCFVAVAILMAVYIIVEEELDALSTPDAEDIDAGTPEVQQDLREDVGQAAGFDGGTR